MWLLWLFQATGKKIIMSESLANVAVVAVPSYWKRNRYE
jgi:hypothetical protein